jgi:hypothetical protein
MFIRSAAVGLLRWIDWRIFFLAQRSMRLLVFADQVLYPQVVSPPSGFSGMVIS